MILTYEQYVDANGPQLLNVVGPYILAHPEFIDSDQNARLLIDYFRTNNFPITPENVAIVVAQHVKAQAEHPEYGWKITLSPQELSLQNMRNNFTAAQLAAFDAWWGRQKHLVHTPQSESSILAQLVGRVFTNDNFDAAAGRCSHTGQVEEHRSVHYQPGQYSNRTDLTDSVKPEEMLDVFGQPIHKSTAYRGSIREQYEAAVAARAERDHTPESNSQAEAQREAEAMRGNTYSRTDQIQKMFITTQSGAIDWVATRNVRRQIQDMPGDGRGSGRSA